MTITVMTQTRARFAQTSVPVVHSYGQSPMQNRNTNRARPSAAGLGAVAR
jgi:hypothetical protein